MEREDWEGAAAASLDPSLMSPAELAEYEDKKLKMRRVAVLFTAVPVFASRLHLYAW